MVFTGRGSLGFLRRKLDTFKGTAPRFRWQLHFHINRLGIGRVPTQKSIFRRKENISEGMCKAGLLGQVSTQRALCTVKKKKTCRSCSPGPGRSLLKRCTLSPVWGQAKLVLRVPFQSPDWAQDNKETLTQLWVVCPNLSWASCDVDNVGSRRDAKSALDKTHLFSMKVELGFSLDASTQGCSRQDPVNFQPGHGVRFPHGLSVCAQFSCKKSSSGPLSLWGNRDCFLLNWKCKWELLLASSHLG